MPHVHTYHPETQKIAHFILDVLSFAPIKTTLPFGNLCNGKVEGAGPDSAFRVCGKKGRIPVKVRSQHINVDNCRYLHIRKSENPDFHLCSQIFGEVSQKYEDMQRVAEICGY